MPFLDTEPAPILRVDTSADPWARFRINDPRQRAALLREICRADVPLTLAGAAGPAVRALLWSVDDRRNRLHFSLSPQARQLDELVASPELWAAGYLQQAKLQFDLRGLVLERSGPRPMLHAEAPHLMLQLPRRRAPRVRRSMALSPALSFRHPQQESRVLRLRVLDIGVGGCALWLPADSLALEVGSLVRQAELELDAQALIHADLEVLQAAPARGAPGGLRLGCRWVGLNAESELTLQRWIAQGHRRRELVSLAQD
jgi:c-di-GMP-binding flagellar brake protein YcgR